MGYIPVPIDTEPVDLAEDAFGYIEQQVPGWLPAPGNLESWLIESLAQMAGELRELAALVPDAIFQFYGSSILALPPYAAQSATGPTNWTMIDSAGYTVNAGTLVAITPAGSTDAFAFEVVDDFTVAAGQTVAAAIQVRAIEAGAAASGITGAVEVLDPLDFVQSVVLTAATSGGIDAEESDDYLDRLSDLMTLLAPRPILPQDFAVMAVKEVPGVERATAIDLYKADTGTPGTPRCVTVVCVDANGNACAAAVKNQVLALLQGRREVNFLVYVADPTYTTIDVTVDVTAFPDYDLTDVQTRVKADLAAYLSPSNWGLPPYGDTSARSWINDTKVRYLELAEVVNRTDGVHWINTLTFRVSGGTMATADITLTGVAPLPRSGVITATVQPAP